MFSSRPLRVSVRHRSPVVTAGLATLLACRDFHLTGALVDGDADMAEVVVTDPAQALQVARATRRATVRPAIVAIALQFRAQEARTVVAAGVRGYLLLPDCDTDTLARCIETVARGGHHHDPAVSGGLAASLCWLPLTVREEEVLQQLALGLCNKGIAARLAIGSGTVKMHVQAVMHKLGAATRTEAAAIAWRRGLIVAEAVPMDAPARARRTTARLA